jgi:hypothetical protein
MPQPIAEIIRHGVLFDVKNWKNPVFSSDNLMALVEQLFTMLTEREIDYLLVGGVALLSYIKGRNTQDIGLILAKLDLNRLPEISLTDENQDFARGMFQDLQIDLRLTQNGLFNQVKQNYATARQFGALLRRYRKGRTLTCATVEGLLLLKFYALPSLYRQGDFNRVSIYENDILQLLLSHQAQLPPLLKVLERYLSATDLQEIQSIAADIQDRIARFQTSRQRLGDA